jgi:hypothetical protein
VEDSNMTAMQKKLKLVTREKAQAMRAPIKNVSTMVTCLRKSRLNMAF